MMRDGSGKAWIMNVRSLLATRLFPFQGNGFQAVSGERELKSINVQIPSGKMDIIDYILQRGGYVSSYTPRERRDTPLTSFTVTVDVPEDRQEEIINQIKQLGGHVLPDAM
jgi:hypothetical protein